MRVCHQNTTGVALRRRFYTSWVFNTNKHKQNARMLQIHMLPTILNQMIRKSTSWCLRFHLHRGKPSHIWQQRNMRMWHPVCGAKTACYIEKDIRKWWLATEKWKWLVLRTKFSPVDHSLGGFTPEDGINLMWWKHNCIEKSIHEPKTQIIWKWGKIHKCHSIKMKILNTVIKKQPSVNFTFYSQDKQHHLKLSVQPFPFQGPQCLFKKMGCLGGPL